jgi:methionyl-tRNA formyltransferase
MTPGSDSAPHEKRVLFMGSKPIGRRVLRVLRETATVAGALIVDDRADDRSVLSEFIADGESAGFPLHVVGSQKEANRWIEDLAPDIAIVVGWYWFIPTQVLRSVSGGFLGLHNSLLPKYRGASPLVWAIINGEAEAGISLFAMTPNLDEGDVYARRATAIKPPDTIGTVLARLEDAAEELFRADFHRILEGQVRPSSQDHAAATSFPQRTPDDGLIDWSEPAARIHDFVRAQTHPYPGAFTGRDGARLTVWQTALSARTSDATPGTIVEVSEDGILVACGRGGCVRIVTVGAPGGPDRPASDVGARSGDRLGPPAVPPA